MYINHPFPSAEWPDLTMTAMMRKRFEACESVLAGLPPRALFDPETNDTDAEELYLSSWYATEEKRTALQTIDGLRNRVLSDLTVEVSLLSPGEHDLLVRAVILGGILPLRQSEYLFAAIALARRLLGRVERQHRSATLIIPRSVCMAVLLSLAGKPVHEVHEKCLHIFGTVDNTLYLAGAMKAETAVKEMGRALQQTIAADRPRLYLRALKADFETFVDRDGQLYLIHSGLAHPQRLLDERARLSGLSPHFLDDQPHLLEAYHSLTMLEDPLYDRLEALLQGVTRQETSPEDVSEDLFLLAKQGASPADLRDVLAMQLVCLPTEPMLETLREIAARVPRWSSMNMTAMQ